MKKFKVQFLYTLYALAALIFFLYALFPEEAANRFVAQDLENRFPECRIRIERLSPTFPPGIRLHEAIVSNHSDMLIEISEARFRPDFLALLRGRTAFSFDGTAYEGSFSGQVEFGPEKFRGRPNAADMSLSGVRIQEMELKNLGNGAEFTAILDGSLSYHQDAKTGGSLNANLAFSDVTLMIPVFGEEKEPLHFSNFNVDAAVARQAITIKKGEFKGTEMDGELTGSVRLSDPLPKSRMNLSLNLFPRPEFQEKLSSLLPMAALQNKSGNQAGFKLNLIGTLENPNVSLAR